MSYYDEQRNAEARMVRSGVKAAGYGLAGIAALGTVFGSMVRVSPKEAVVVTDDITGQIVAVYKEPALHFKRPWIQSSHSYDLRRDKGGVTAETSLRTSDDIRLINPFTVEFEIDEKADIQKLYIDSRGQDVSDIVSQRAKDSAVRVFETLRVTDLAEPGVTDKIKSLILHKLQEDLDKEGWPIKIRTVLTDGFKLDPKSEEELAKIISYRQEAARLDLRQENAIKALSVMAKEAQSDAAYIDGLAKSGVPKEGLVCALYIKKLVDANRIGVPLVAGCDASQAVSVAVPGPANDR